MRKLTSVSAAVIQTFALLAVVHSASQTTTTKLYMNFYSSNDGSEEKAKKNMKRK